MITCDKGSSYTQEVRGNALRAKSMILILPQNKKPIKPFVWTLKKIKQYQRKKIGHTIKAKSFLLQKTVQWKKEVAIFSLIWFEWKRMVFSFNGEQHFKWRSLKISTSSYYELEMLSVNLFIQFLIPFWRKWNLKTNHTYATVLFFIYRLKIE